MIVPLKPAFPIAMFDCGRVRKRSLIYLYDLCVLLMTDEPMFKSGPTSER